MNRFSEIAAVAAAQQIIKHLASLTQEVSSKAYARQREQRLEQWRELIATAASQEQALQEVEVPRRRTVKVKAAPAAPPAPVVINHVESAGA